MNETNLVAFASGEFTPDVHYVASLSDGSTVVQDDRPGVEAAWLRLGKYLKANSGLKITGLKLVCGTTEVVMPTAQKGYFFGNSAKAVFPDGGQCVHRGVGSFDGSMVSITWGAMPDLRSRQTEERTKAAAGFFLIENPED